MKTFRLAFLLFIAFQFILLEDALCDDFQPRVIVKQLYPDPAGQDTVWGYRDLKILALKSNYYHCEFTDSITVERTAAISKMDLPALPKKINKLKNNTYAIMTITVGEDGKIIYRNELLAGPQHCDFFSDIISGLDKWEFIPAFAGGRAVAQPMVFIFHVVVDNKNQPEDPEVPKAIAELYSHPMGQPIKQMGNFVLPQLRHEERIELSNHIDVHRKSVLQMQGIIDCFGKMIYVAVESSSGEPFAEFEKASLSAAIRNEYTPATYDGIPIGVMIAWLLTFTVED